MCRLRTRRFRIGVFTSILMLWAGACSTPDPNSDHFSVRISTPQQEAEYVCQLIEGIGYYRSRGYTPELPDHPLVDAGVQEAAEGRFDPSLCATLYPLFEEELYEARLYTGPYRRAIRALPELDQAHDVFLHYDETWGFRTFDAYEILLTLYGPGGTFDAQEGRIWLAITDAGSFKMGNEPGMVILHEAVHVGIDEPIVRRFGLSQRVTERIVDRFIVDHFSALMPDYVSQGLGDPSIDPYLDQADSWERLPEYVARYADGSGLPGQ